MFWSQWHLFLDQVVLKMSCMSLRFPLKRHQIRVFNLSSIRNIYIVHTPFFVKFYCSPPGVKITSRNTPMTHYDDSPRSMKKRSMVEDIPWPLPLLTCNFPHQQSETWFSPSPIHLLNYSIPVYMWGTFILIKL